MKYEIQKSPGVTKVVLAGRMRFSDHGMFRDIMKMLDLPAGDCVVFEMSGLDFIDSSGLGMLIVAREESMKRELEFVIENPRDGVMRLLDMTKTSHFFTIRP